MDSSTDLVRRMRCGDPAAFDALCARYRPRIFAFLVRMTARREVAEELLQETLLRLVTHSHTLRDDTRIDAWLFTIARNQARAWHRRRLFDLDRLLAFHPAPASSPFEDLAADESLRALERAIAALPPRYREVLLLVGVERMTAAEAATVLGLRPDAARQRLSRARAMLAAALEAAEGIMPIGLSQEEIP